MPVLSGFGQLVVCTHNYVASHRNLPKAIGAYFDFNFESNIDFSHSLSCVVRPQPPLYDAKFHPSPHSVPKATPTLIWCVQNSGIASWPVGSYLTVEVVFICISFTILRLNLI